MKRVLYWMLSRINYVYECIPNIAPDPHFCEHHIYYFDDGPAKEACPCFGVAEEALDCGLEVFLEGQSVRAFWRRWYILMAWLRGFTVAEIRASIAR